MFGLCRVQGTHVPPRTTATKDQLRQALAMMTGRNPSDIDVFDQPEWSLISDRKTENRLERYRRQGSGGIDFSDEPEWTLILDPETEEKLERYRRQGRGEIDISDEPEEEPSPESECQESYEERLERWEHYFIQGPLMRCLDVGEEKAFLEDLLYERFLEEVHIFQDFQEVGEDGKKIKVLGDRGEYKTSAYWRNVRNDLRVDDEEVHHDWPWVGSWPQDDGPLTLKLGPNIRRWWKRKPRKPKFPVVNKILEKTEITMGKETQEEAEERRKQKIKDRKQKAEVCRQTGLERWRESEVKKRRQRKEV